MRYFPNVKYYFAIFSEFYKGVVLMTLKERIKELCDIENISFNKLECELGFGSGYLSKLGKSTPTAKNIQKIADRFHVSVDYLLYGEEFSDENAKLTSLIRNDAELSKALSKYAKMTDDKKKLVVKYINMLDEV
jgi:transcriptional regulator with XRE-family HTH domain